MSESNKYKMETRDLIALSMVKGIGPAFIKKNISFIKQLTDIRSIVSTRNKEEYENIPMYLEKAESIIRDCECGSTNIVNILSSDYPSRLFEINDPPSVLYTKGNMDLLRNPIAIIGTRHSTYLGERIAKNVGLYFSENYSICNGLAEGIDDASISGLMPSNVIGVISGGLSYEETCSKTHADSIERVLSGGGLIVTEYPPHKKEDAFSGSKASRIQAGLSCGVVLVQSSVNGGSKYTVATLAKLNRPLGVLCYDSSEEYQTHDSFGANRLIQIKNIDGVAEFTGVKNPQISCLQMIKTKEDYIRLENSLQENNVFFT